jgi:hypothetical protein
MGVFDGIEHVAAEGRSSLRQYFEPGNYSVTIDRVFLHEKRLGGGKLFIVSKPTRAGRQFIQHVWGIYGEKR